MKSGQKITKLTIGRLATAAGVGIGTIRHYQKLGLLTEPGKPHFGGYRVYAEKHLERLLQIKGAQELGFTLTEIAEILTQLHKQDCQSIKTTLEEKIRSIDIKIVELGKVRKEIGDLLSRCNGCCTDVCAVMSHISSRKTAR